MKTIYKFSNRAAIEREAAEWLIKLERDTKPTAEELKALQAWINRSPVHREEINSLAVFWGNMNVLTELAVPLGKTEIQIALESSKKRSRNSLRGFFIAASVCGFAFAIAFAYMLFSGDGMLQNKDAGFYATVVGQQKTTTLDDGSVIHLNTNTQLEVNYSHQFRDILLLQGEAHFTVAKNSSRPFRVRAGKGRVQAIGTAFSVYLNGQNLDVTVTEGRVGLAFINEPQVEEADTEGNPVSDSSVGRILEREPNRGLTTVDRSESFVEEELGLLEAGQATTIKNALSKGLHLAGELELVERVTKDEMEKRLLWRKGLLKFTGDPLEDVVKEISRYTSLSIEITDPAVRALRIGGQFRVGETDAMFRSLEVNFGIHVARVGHNRVQLSLDKD
ncbi:DUF4880 domain-containing protein [Exilibacterium tricleocarpae]|uniref:DUF4880 domain-containing protein n=1 Tax=Exilibacterium tricleocarpae TaxID=2591008 RepID=A0A545TNV0_9GAMM|nr:FecR domain-containing protein [Exilibacterium tricleocarpae]TQV78893.1 DUF4880 domain-containing protein [Exilibacterium tricleocarpae]